MLLFYANFKETKLNSKWKYREKNAKCHFFTVEEYKIYKHIYKGLLWLRGKFSLKLPGVEVEFSNNAAGVKISIYR